jgi:hypothetical protein
MYFGSAFAMVALPAAMRMGGAHFAMIAMGCIAFVWLWAWVAAEKKGMLVSFETAEPELLPGAQGVSAQPRTPWGALISSPAVLVIMLNNFTFHYAFFVVMSWMPTFYEQKLGLHVASYTALKMTPYLITGLCSNVGGVFADKIMESGEYSRTFIRKALNSAGFTVGSLSLWLLPLCATLFSVTFVSSIALGALAISRAGYALNHMDIAPRLAGVLMGISNGCGAIAGMIGPWLTGLILDTASDPWEAAFRIPAYFCIFGALMYVQFATAEQLFD